jgi:hypothetical protein
MLTSSNYTKAFVQCCHGKHTVASSRTLLSDHVCRTDCSQHRDQGEGEQPKHPTWTAGQTAELTMTTAYKYRIAKSFI